MTLNNPRNTKKLLIIAVIIVCSIIGYSIYISLERAGKEPVSVYAIPSDATITANGQEISPGTSYLKAGTYEIEAKRGGFSSYKETITITSNNKTDIDIALYGVSEAAKEWEKKNEKLYLEREGRGGKRAAAYGEAFTNANPITKELPYKNVIFSIGYHLDPSDPTNQSIIIDIDAGPGYASGALQKIRDLGYDPSDFRINFKNITSPFSK